MADISGAFAGWWHGQRRRNQAVLTVLAGLVASLGQAPFSAVWLALPGFALAAMIFQQERALGLRRAALAGWLTGLGYFGLTMVWIVQPFLVDPVRHGWMAPFAVVFMAAGLALFWGGATWLAARAGRLALPAWVVALTGAELLRSHIFTGLPWGLIGHVWIGSGGLQWAAYGGGTLLTVLALIPAALAASLRPLGLTLAVVSALAVGLGGAALPKDPPTTTGPVLRLVQPDIRQSLKWNRDTVEATIATLLGLTSAPADPALGPPALTIWPETSVPYLLDSAGTLLAEIVQASGGTPVVVGAVRVDGFRGYNSLAVLGQGGRITELYDKHHLVPFGEYLPFGWIWERIGLSALTAQQGNGYTAGPGARLLDFGPLGRAVPLICYEAVFPQDIRAAPGRADWLLQITNDAWFGHFSGPYQHLAQARLRAVEQGLPMVRAANTGISAVIDAHGRVVASLALDTGGHLDARLPPSLPPTIYARTGDLPAAIALMIALAGLLIAGRRESH